jgi:hypothetical protein
MMRIGSLLKKAGRWIFNTDFIFRPPDGQIRICLWKPDGN